MGAIGHFSHCMGNPCVCEPEEGIRTIRVDARAELRTVSVNGSYIRTEVYDYMRGMWVILDHAPETHDSGGTDA